MIQATIFSLVLLPAVVFAQPQAKVPAEKDLEALPVSDIAQEIDLTSEQKEQIKEQKYQTEHKRIETQNKLRLKELELRHELEKKDTDKAAVEAIVKDLKGLQGTMLEQRVNSILELKKILTPEQFEKLRAFEQKRGGAIKGIKSKLQQRMRNKF